mmetsp:Transcript_5992/g.10840  ORF Transcript_5992/g.10840 Transcript_5992/m.10840 type:complete len:432 (+) Transcript_5992:1706-3001(+)
MWGPSACPEFAGLEPFAQTPGGDTQERAIAIPLAEDLHVHDPVPVRKAHDLDARRSSGPGPEVDLVRGEADGVPPRAGDHHVVPCLEQPRPPHVVPFREIEALDPILPRCTPQRRQPRLFQEPVPAHHHDVQGVFAVLRGVHNGLPLFLGHRYDGCDATIGWKTQQGRGKLAAALAGGNGNLVRREGIEDPVVADHEDHVMVTAREEMRHHVRGPWGVVHAVRACLGHPHGPLRGSRLPFDHGSGHPLDVTPVGDGDEAAVVGQDVLHRQAPGVPLQDLRAPGPAEGLFHGFQLLRNLTVDPGIVRNEPLQVGDGLCESLGLRLKLTPLQRREAAQAQGQHRVCLRLAQEQTRPPNDRIILGFAALQCLFGLRRVLAGPDQCNDVRDPRLRDEHALHDVLPGLGILQTETGPADAASVPEVQPVVEDHTQG